MVAQSDCGAETCRNRQMYSISFWGSSRVLGMSMKEERVFTPGGLEAFGGAGWLVGCDRGFERGLEGIRGAGGGGGKGDVDGTEGEGVVTMVAFFLRLWILSL